MPISEIYKIILVVIFVGILISLALSVAFLIKDKGNKTRIAKTLTVRIVLSVTLFCLLIFGFFAGLLKPHGLMPPGQIVPAEQVIKSQP